MTKYELRRLLDYDEKGILEELRRVARLIETPIITGRAFDKLSKVHSTTVRKRFGGWHTALEKAGLGHRYSGAAVTERMRNRHGEVTDEEVTEELRRVARELKTVTFTAKNFDAVARFHSATVVRHFGSWAAALKKAGLKPGKGAVRYTEADYFENLLKVWTHYGRQPTYGEMDLPPSTISSGAYEHKWGKWTNALRAFVEQMENDTDESDASSQSNAAGLEDVRSAVAPTDNPHQHPKPVTAGLRSRTPSPRLQFLVMRRDNFKCPDMGSGYGVRSCILYSRLALIVPMGNGSSPQRSMQGYTKNPVRRESNQPERDALIVRAVHRDEYSQREVEIF